MEDAPQFGGLSVTTTAIGHQISVQRCEFGVRHVLALVRPGQEVELCTAVPGIEVDLFVETSVDSLTGILLARTSVAKEISRENLYVSGDATLSKTMDAWLPQSSYADFEGIAKI